MLAGEVEGDAELSRLEMGLAIELVSLESEAAAQPALAYRAALRAARLEAAAAAAEMEHTSARSRALGFLRAQAEQQALPPSDAVLEARAHQVADVAAAARKAAEAQRQLSQALALRDAYRHRGELLLTLCRALRRK